jgi:hypothetical protein
LSLRQPWAWLVSEGLKPIENRSWNTNLRGRFDVHASVMTEKDWREAWAMVERAAPHLLGLLQRARDRGLLHLGGIVGRADLVMVLDPVPLIRIDSWRIAGQYGFVLEHAETLPFIPCKGALSFWNIIPDVREQLSHIGERKTQP